VAYIIYAIAWSGLQTACLLLLVLDESDFFTARWRSDEHYSAVSPPQHGGMARLSWPELLLLAVVCRLPVCYYWCSMRLNSSPPGGPVMSIIQLRLRLSMARRVCLLFSVSYRPCS